MTHVIMRIHKYIPDRMFGFAVGVGVADEGLEVFFHLGSFDSGTVWMRHPRCDDCPVFKCPWPESPPPPILGEEVDVYYDDQEPTDSGKVPRASKVIRRAGPPVIYGRVETFDSQRGYGFVTGEDGVSYHLHSSEILEGRIPRPGQNVMFFSGMRQSKPRACHVRICP